VNHMKRIPVVVLAFLGISIALPLAAMQDQAPDQATSIMRVDHETKLLWERMSLSAPAFTWERSMQQSFASSLSLLSHLNYVPAERNQGSCGNCWQWAGTGAMEIALDVQETIYDRLSVQFINSCNPAKALCEGGWLTDFAGFYAAQGYAIPWSNTNAQWQSGNGSNVICDTIAKTPNYGIQSIAAQQVLTHSVGQAQAIANIKAALNQNKPVWFGFFMSTSADWTAFSNFWANQNETAVWSDFFFGKAWTSGGGGHAVLVVGYNDDDPANPYWIMLNSWGTAGGRRPNGLFRVAMNLNYDGADASGSYSLFWQTLGVTFTTGNTVAAPVLSAEPATTAGTSNTISWTPGVAGSALGSGGTAGTGIASDYAAAGLPAGPTVPSAAVGELGSAAAGVFARRTAALHVVSQSDDAKAQLPTSPPEAWQWICSESFEGGFPATNWTLYGTPTWDDTNYAALAGSWSGWCAASGVSPSSGYPNNMDAWMIYGPFSLAGATNAQVNFWYKNVSEADHDYLQWMASTDGINFYGTQTSGSQSTWTTAAFDLTSVPVLGNLCGQSQVWFALRFVSDGSGSGLPGAYVDEIVIQKDVLPAIPDLAPYMPAGWTDKLPVGSTQLAGDAAHTYSGPFYNNQVLYFNWASLNQGTGAAGAYRVHVEVTGTGGGTWDWDISNNPVNQYWYLLTDQSVGPLAAGSHTFKIWTDYLGTVSESNESNNYYERIISISAPSLADLTPYKPDVWNDKIPIGTTQLAGNAVHAYTGSFFDNQLLFLNWTSLNQGTGAAGPSRLHIEVTGTGGGTWDWDIPSHNASQYFYLATDQSVGPLAAGSHTFKVWVDYLGAVSEADETNNYYERTITVSASAATEYYAECADNQNFTSPMNSGWITATSRTFNGLTPGTTYWYRVKARQGAVQSTWSNVEHSQQQAQVLNPLLADFGAGRGLFSFSGTAWSMLSGWDPVRIVEWTGGFAIDFGPGKGLFNYSGTAWTYLTSWNPESMVKYGTSLLADFGAGRGLFQYNGTSWIQLSAWDPVLTTEWAGGLAVDFGAGKGLYNYNGSSWTYLTGWNPESMVKWSTKLALDFGAGKGLFTYNGSSWTMLTSWNPEQMVEWTGGLAVDFGLSHGLYTHNGSSWTMLTGWDPQAMVKWGSNLVIDFGSGKGLFYYAGSTWTMLSGWDPEAAVEWGSKLVVDFGAAKGLFTFDGSLWALLTGWDPQAVLAALYH